MYKDERIGLVKITMRESFLTVGSILFNISENTSIDFSKFPSLKLVFKECYMNVDTGEDADCTFVIDVDPEIAPLLPQVLKNALCIDTTIRGSKLKYNEVLGMKYTAFTCTCEQSPLNNRELYSLIFEIPGLYNAYEKANQSEVLGQ